MRRYWLLSGLMLATFLALFIVAEWLQLPILTDPSPWMQGGVGPAALIGVGLLVADVFLPVPSSLVMLLHGALFGVVWGTLLSLVGSLGATLLGFAVGRRGGGLIRRLVTPAEQARANRLLLRWGALAILITRPIPLLAETVAILAGASPLGWGRVTVAALLGALPGALLYALAGATATTVESGLLSFLLVIAIAALFWRLSQRWVPSAPSELPS